MRHWWLQRIILQGCESLSGVIISDPTSGNIFQHSSVSSTCVNTVAGGIDNLICVLSRTVHGQYRKQSFVIKSHVSYTQWTNEVFWYHGFVHTCTIDIFKVYVITIPSSWQSLAKLKAGNMKLYQCTVLCVGCSQSQLFIHLLEMYITSIFVSKSFSIRYIKLD